MFYNGEKVDIPPCQYKRSERLEKYDGWLAYTTYQYPDGVEKFLGYFSVPEAPQRTPQVLYIFTGLQNVDWVFL